MDKKQKRNLQITQIIKKSNLIAIPKILKYSWTRPCEGTKRKDIAWIVKFSNDQCSCGFNYEKLYSSNIQMLGIN